MGFKMVDFHRFTIPIIVILIIGGTISFFLAYGFYPEKHVNVKVDEKCYELLDNAFTKYNRLQAERELLVLKLQTNAIESPDAVVPVIFSGTKEEIDNLISDYHLKINNSQRLEEINKNWDFDKRCYYRIVNRVKDGIEEDVVGSITDKLVRTKICGVYEISGIRT